MFRSRAIALVLVAVFPVLLSATAIPGDVGRGAELFQTQKCVVCHSLGGEGGKMAPDLATGLSRDYKPTSMASFLWDHAPSMWTAMKEKGIALPRIDEDQAGDLYSYLYSRNYFAQPGDAGRGKRVFTDKGCADCHGTDSPKHPDAKPVSQWEQTRDPIGLIQQLWNHSATMKEALAAKSKKWPTLTGDDFRDLSVYLRTLPIAQPVAREFKMASPATGKDLFAIKGCAGCHTGKLSLFGKFPGRSMDDFAAAMWNHSSRMGKPAPELRSEEMSRIAGYLWANQYFEDKGNRAKGERAFTQKGCAGCHSGSGPGPKLSGKEQLNSIGFVSVIWQHGPQMLSMMQQKGVKWPQMSESDVRDVLTYINSLP